MADAVVLAAFNLAGGNYSSDSIEVSEYRVGLNVQLVLTGLNGSVTFSIESSNDNANWVEIDNSQGDLPLTTTGGTHMVSIDGFIVGQYVKFKVTKVTATAGTCQIIYLIAKTE